jgi:hypothetical protein
MSELTSASDTVTNGHLKAKLARSWLGDRTFPDIGAREFFLILEPFKDAWSFREYQRCHVDLALGTIDKADEERD